MLDIGCDVCDVCTLYVFFFKQKTAYEMRISDWSSDVCSSDLAGNRAAGEIGQRAAQPGHRGLRLRGVHRLVIMAAVVVPAEAPPMLLQDAMHGFALPAGQHIQPEQHRPEAVLLAHLVRGRSEEHTSDPQSLRRNSYALLRLQ